MPNHCENVVTLKGKFDHRQEFVDKNKGFTWEDTMKEKEYRELSFHASVPMPKRLVQTKGEGWYNWCIKNWGTKWECWDEGLSHDKDQTHYYFTTAWSPPNDWLQNVSRKFPHIEFEVEWAEEAGEGGKFMYHGGDLFYDTEMTEEQWKEFMGYEDDEE